MYSGITVYAELKWDFTFSLSYVNKIWKVYPSIFKTTYARYSNKSENLIKDISFTKFNIEFSGNVSFVTIHVISIPSIYNILFVSFILSNAENLSQTNLYFSYICDSLMCSFTRKENVDGYQYKTYVGIHGMRWN